MSSSFTGHFAATQSISTAGAKTRDYVVSGQIRPEMKERFITSACRTEPSLRGSQVAALPSPVSWLDVWPSSSKKNECRFCSEICKAIKPRLALRYEASKTKVLFSKTRTQSGPRLGPSGRGSLSQWVRLSLQKMSLPRSVIGYLLIKVLPRVLVFGCPTRTMSSAE